MRPDRHTRPLCLVSSGGGHLEQIRSLKPVYEGGRRYFVVPVGIGADQLDAEESHYFHPDVNEGRGIRNPILLMRAIVLAVALLVIRRPSAVVSTGGGTAVPLFVAATLLGIRRVYIESFARVTRPSVSGRVCYPLAHLFLIQHPALKRHYHRAVYCGPLYRNM